MELEVVDNSSLVSGLRDGNRDSYILIYERYYKLLCKYAFSIIKREDLAEETVQQVMVSIWEKRESLSLDNIKFYLLRAVYNQSLNCLKNQQNAIVSFEDYSHFQIKDESNDLLKCLENKELLQQIKQTINHLPENTKKVFLMNRQYKLKYREIAEKLGITVKGVEFHMSKALRILNESIKEYVPVLIFILSLSLHIFANLTRVLFVSLVLIIGGNYGF